jgi:hypothetical protein
MKLLEAETLYVAAVTRLERATAVLEALPEYQEYLQAYDAVKNAEIMFDRARTALAWQVYDKNQEV